jgi:hypothetical protein
MGWKYEVRQVRVCGIEEGYGLRLEWGGGFLIFVGGGCE